MSALPKRDRRINGRVVIPYPARFFGVDIDGRFFKETTHVENISACGVYMRLKKGVRLMSRVGVAVRLSYGPTTEPALRLATRGIVVRTEVLTDGTFGVAIEFLRRRML